jgi:hypothetical protein
MRKNKGLLTIGIFLVLVTASLYVIYSSMDSSSGPRHRGLGSLLDAGAGANVAELSGEGAKQVIDVLQYTPQWTGAIEFLLTKGFHFDPTYMYVYQVNMGGYVLSILRSYSVPSANGTIAEIIMVRDDDGRDSIWIMVTNLPTAISWGSTAAEIPVFTFSNGMPVFFVTFYHLVGDVWIPYHYWWHSAQNHPNWYYSVYKYWWHYYDWYLIDWPFWYDGFFAWYYNIRFYYWSTYFPMSEAAGIMAGLLIAIAAFRMSLRRI